MMDHAGKRFFMLLVGTLRGVVKSADRLKSPYWRDKRISVRKCQVLVGAYGRWSLTRALTMLGQNFSSLDLPHVLEVLFMRKVNFRE